MPNISDIYWITFLIMVCKNYSACKQTGAKITAYGWTAAAMFAFPIIPQVIFDVIDLFVY